jgi:regulator of sigma D
VHRIKVEILIPRFYNDSRPVEGRKFRLIMDEIYDQFNGYTLDTSLLHGEWKDPKTNKKYKDTSFACWIVCDNTYQNMHFLKELKQRLQERFEQEDILIYHTDIILLD